MSVTIPSNAVVTVRHEYLLEDNVAYNVLHYRLVNATVLATGLPVATEPLASAAIPALAEGAFIPWATAWTPAAASTVFYTGVTAQKVFPGDRSIPYHYIPPAAEEGLIDSEPLPLQDSITILKKTGFGTRWGMGRLYFVGIPESHQTGGRIDGALGVLLNAVASAMLSDLVVDDGVVQYTWRPVVTNVPTTLFPHVNDIEITVVSDGIIKSQRRRRPGKGI